MFGPQPERVFIYLFLFSYAYTPTTCVVGVLICTKLYVYSFLFRGVMLFF